MGSLAGQKYKRWEPNRATTENLGFNEIQN